MAKKKKKKTRLYISLGAIALLLLVWLLTPSDAGFKQSNTWQRAAIPGHLSVAHASLENNCSACHTAVTGVDPVNCIACHADNQTLLQSQPTAFHAHVGTCKDCHPEHRGRDKRPTTMDHVVFAKVGVWQAQIDNPDEEKQRLFQLRATLEYIQHEPLPNAHILREELILNCVTCHSKEDPHAGYFGNDCAVCHGTSNWTLPEYIHPPASSRDCAQCHKTPPSHLSSMFTSMCAKSLGKKPRSIKQCYVCHTIYSWNDLKGAPWHRKTKSHRALRD